MGSIPIRDVYRLYVAFDIQVFFVSFSGDIAVSDVTATSTAKAKPPYLGKEASFVIS